GLAGREREHLLVGRDGAGRGCELLGSGAGETEAGGDAFILLLGVGDDQRLHPGHALPVARGAVGDLRERGRAAGLAVGRPRLLHVLEGLGDGVLATVAVGDVGCAGVERALERALAGGGFREVARDQVAPLGALGLVVVDGLLGGGIVFADVAQAMVGRERLF